MTITLVHNPDGSASVLLRRADETLWPLASDVPPDIAEAVLARSLQAEEQAEDWLETLVDVSAGELRG